VFEYAGMKVILLQVMEFSYTQIHKKQHIQSVLRVMRMVCYT